MKILPQISIDKYVYDLPEERIAYQPASYRDQSGLLIYRQGNISKDRFINLVNYLPADGLIVCNDTRVVQARLIFEKTTGAKIEIFCLEPADRGKSLHGAYDSCSPVVWKCFVGNVSKWKSGILEKQDDKTGKILRAEKAGRDEDIFFINFSWNPPSTGFAEILELFGRVPLPPYIQRDDNDEDKIRYQTTYNTKPGSVAAATAGLHFSDKLLKKIATKNIPIFHVTLHIGAGTFKPVTTQYVDKHKMHHEQFSVSLETIEKLFSEDHRPYVIVGTTTVRTLESLYWFGVRLLRNSKKEQCPVEVAQWEPYKYDFDDLPSRKEVLKSIYQWMRQNDLENITGTTSLMIVPGYRYQMTDVLITNFHQPASTLLLLVAAFTGNDWRSIYDYALNNDFRFLSYGDSCLLYKNRSLNLP